MKPSAAPSSTQRMISLGDMVRRTDEGRPRRCYASRAISRRVRFFSRAVFLIRSVVARKLFLPMSPISGKGFIQRIDAEIVMIEEPAEIEQRFLDGDQACGSPDTWLLGLLRCRADHRSDAGKDADFSRAAPCAIALCLTCL
jgi:hypothetical protein